MNFHDISNLLRARRDLIQKTGRPPLSLSDWHFTNFSIPLPEKMISKSYDDAVTLSRDYLYSAYLPEIEGFIKGNLANQLAERVSVRLAHNATTAISTSLRAMKQSGKKRVLFITPNYFASLETIDRCGFSSSYVHIYPDDNQDIAFHKIVEGIKNQHPDIIMVCNPFFCLGMSLNKDQWKNLATIVNQKEGILFCDNAIGGVSVDSKKFYPVPEKLFENISLFERFVLIDSPSKRFLLNGLKLSVVYDNADLANLIDSETDISSGGINADQVSIAKHFYSDKYRSELDKVTSYISKTISENVQFLNSAFSNRRLKLVFSGEGWFACLHNQDMTPNESEMLARKLLAEEEVFFIPLHHFLFHESAGSGFRVNLLKEMESISRSTHALLRVLD